jgi:hypothetical protein
MTLSDVGTITNLLSAIAVLGTLIYLSRQVKQGNLLAKAQARQRMVEQTNEELYVLASTSAPTGRATGGPRLAALVSTQTLSLTLTHSSPSDRRRPTSRT